MLFFYHHNNNNNITLSSDIRVHRAGSQLNIRVHRAGSQQKILFTKEIIKHFDKLLQYRQEHILLFGLNGDNNLRQIVN